MAQEKETFAGRWSRLKQESREEKSLPEPEKPLPEQQAALEKPVELPPVDQLTPDADFSLFMNPKVQDGLRRAALKKLFADPHFNIPDPFEAYSGDWTGGEPISQEMLATLNQARTLLFADQEKREKQQEERAVEPEPKKDEPGKQDA